LAEVLLLFLVRNVPPRAPFSILGCFFGKLKSMLCICLMLLLRKTGLGFMGLQTLAYKGYIHIDHDRMKKDMEAAMDLNKDGKVSREHLILFFSWNACLR
jgi:uncharacterized membrane protein (Fun14 family)